MLAPSDIVSRLPLSPAFAAGLPEAGVRGLLGVIGFGAPGGQALPDIPCAAVDIPPIGSADGGGPLFELWMTDQPVRYGRSEGTRLALTPDLLFGVIEEPEQGPLEALSQGLYARLFGLLSDHGYPYLYRTWTYFPEITALAGGLERYRRFSLGRHDAFAAAGRAVEDAPAASVLGSGSGPITVLFLAGKAPGRPLENPRQVSAYRYPARYGPRSPIFSRAFISRVGGSDQLLISGTASIVGHESRHRGDPRAQAGEAMTNIRTLIAEARAVGLKGERLLLKTYIRDPAMLETVRPVIEGQLGPSDQVVFLKAEICRPELLVEIEGTLI